MGIAPPQVEIPVSAVAYSRLKLLALAIESAFANMDFDEANSLLAERQIVLDELGPMARLNEAQGKDLGEIEARIGWQVHQARAQFNTTFRRVSRTKSVMNAYVGVGHSRFERAG